MPALDPVLAERLDQLEKRYLKRRLPEVREGVISFCDNDYLGLRNDHRVVAASVRATEREGAGSGASRLVAGNHILYAPLEKALAAHKKTQGALVFGSGYLANLGAISALVGEGDLIIADKYCHASMLDGAKLSGAKLVRFRHNDMAHAETLLKSERGQYRNCLVMSESVFSMDGDLAPLADLRRLCDTNDAWLLIDDAHGLGILDQHAAQPDVWTGTLSKALGGYGGYVAGSATLVDALPSLARSLVYTTALPPGVVAAAHEALSIVDTEPERATRAMAYARQFTEAMGLPQALSTIVPVQCGEAEEALRLSVLLMEQGILISPIRPPTVSPGTARLRIAFSARHTEAEVEMLIAAMRKLNGRKAA